RRVLEARGELREQRPELAARGQRIDPPAEFIEVGLVRPNQHLNEVIIFHARRLRASRRLKAVARARNRTSQSFFEHPGMRKALIELDGKLEAGRCAIRPAARDLRARLAVE